MLAFPIIYGKTIVGEAVFYQEGMFYRIECYCRHKNNKYRIRIQNDNDMMDLGCCAPYTNKNGLVRRIPKKLVNTEMLKIIAVSSEELIAVDSKIEFDYLQYLSRSVLTFKEDKAFVKLSGVFDDG